ncbi:tRNA(Ile)-lysidine synthase [Clostridium tepidiprofundi DSM 19306]|uniref:tRNA(Ile)-lysidine synthase n=1 Tax=Clostridium tepidiprofundi DSM 19306 TaxID=1121338 RepID=A0A151B3A1_9CLOT|nr:tRNA lysidine(34) synthetase TilS [Clostridium tepidiprofundi]KYH34376.1 tRNA(Ile)-lysidine synthase [Clostridium tepidiprofundi DSM 19306]
MINNVLNTIEKNKMFNMNDKVIVAVSGGPDSMCLLHILYKIKERYKLEIIVAHLNHCLRGKEADLDEKYVENFCIEKNIEFYSRRVDVHKISKEKNISCEMAGRDARYEFFEELKRKLNAQKIALAHNANDQAETVIMRIMRGTGLEGLTGIKPVRDGYYVRPLINSSRKEIEEYCYSNNINPRIDQTNLENIFSRNKIRLELIPYIEENFNKDIVKTLIRLADTVKNDNEYLEKIAEEKFNAYCSIKNNKLIITKKAFEEEEAILTRIIRRAVMILSGNFYNYTKVHVYDVIKIQRQGTGKKINLPNNIIAINNYGNIEMHKHCEYNDKSDKREIILDIQKRNIINEEGIVISFDIIDVNNDVNRIKRKKGLTKYFDYDKIKKEIVFRHRSTGDFFMPLGMKCNKKLNRMFIDLKIPREERDNVPLICFGDEIAWIVGYRVSERFKIDSNTKKILVINIEREE